MTPRLQVSDTQGKRMVPLDKPLFRIGRRTESDLRVSGIDVSREHAEVEQGGNGGWLLRDRGSRCGTFVNNERVTERVLRHGDQIRLGVKKRCRAGLPAGRAASAPRRQHNGGCRFPSGRLTAR